MWTTDLLGKTNVFHHPPVSCKHFPHSLSLSIYGEKEIVYRYNESGPEEENNEMLGLEFSTVCS